MQRVIHFRMSMLVFIYHSITTTVDRHIYGLLEISKKYFIYCCEKPMQQIVLKKCFLDTTCTAMSLTMLTPGELCI